VTDAGTTSPAAGPTATLTPTPAAAPTTTVPTPPGPIRFRDVTATSGIDFRHTDGSTGKRFIIETVASGVVTFDYDGDGLVDIYFCNGAPLDAMSTAHQDPSEPPRNRLFRNLGQLRFVDVTGEAGVGDVRYSLGATAGDYNEDGYPDLYVSNYGTNTMFRNNGDGSFASVEAEAGTAAIDSHRVGAGVAYLDMDCDGDLDLFVANYLSFSPDQHVEHKWKGITIYSGPLKYPFYQSQLFRNDGDGTFTDVSQESGVQTSLGHGMGIICADVDGDGDTDVFVNNDGSPGNFLFRNDGSGHFDEVAAASGTAFSADGLAIGSMGVDCGDYDNDGRLDFYVTAYQDQLSRLFRNRGGGLFEDVTRETGAGAGTFNRVTWGCSLSDLDNDGWRDIFLACGHLIDNVDLVDDTTSYAQMPIVLRNVDGTSFVNVTASTGSALQQPLVGRGAAFDDFDRDGRTDVVILNSRRAATLLANDSPGDQHWLEIQLIGRKGTRDAVGSHVMVTAAGKRQVAEVHRGRGYQGHYGSRLHFGLGPNDQVERIEIRWLAGATEIIENIEADQVVTILEGRGLVACHPVPFPENQ
jgi:hypothetical protein